MAFINSFGAPGFFPGMPFMGDQFGMGSCCNNIFGGGQMGSGQQIGTILGALTGGVLGAPGGLPGMLLGGAGLGLVGNLLGRLFDNHRNNQQHGQQCQQFPPPCGQGGWGGPSNGCYGGGIPPYQQGYQQGFRDGQAYQSGYQAGYQAGLQAQQGQQWPPRNCWQPNYGGDQCCPGQNVGQLKQEGGEGKPISYTTRGGWNVSIDGHKVIMTDPSGQHKIEHSGDPHEYLNGKHVKDWQGKDRSVILPDGTKISMNADSPNGLVKGVSIYDGDRNIQVDNLNNKITHQSLNSWDTRSREAWQADGETAIVSYGRDGINYSNLYNQDRNLGFTSAYKDIGTMPYKKDTNYRALGWNPQFMFA